MKLKLLVFVVGLANAMELPKITESDLKKSEVSITIVPEEENASLNKYTRISQGAKSNSSYRLLMKAATVPPNAVVTPSPNLEGYRTKFLDTLNEIYQDLDKGKITPEEAQQALKGYRTLCKLLFNEFDDLRTQVEMQGVKTRNHTATSEEIAAILEDRLIRHEEKKADKIISGPTKYCSTLLAIVLLGLTNVGLSAFIAHTNLK